MMSEVIEEVLPKKDIIVDLAVKCPECNSLFPVRLGFYKLFKKISYIRCYKCKLPMSVTYDNEEFIVSSMFNKNFKVDYPLCVNHNRMASISINDKNYCSLCMVNDNLKFSILNRFVVVQKDSELYSEVIKFTELQDNQSFIFIDESWTGFTYFKIGEIVYCVFNGCIIYTIEI